MSGNSLGTWGLTSISSALIDCGLKILLLRSNNFPKEKTGKVFAHLFTKHKKSISLEVLNLTQNNIGDSLIELMQSLADTNIRVFCVGYEPYRADTLRRSFVALKGNLQLTTLCLPSCGVDDDSIDTLCEVLPYIRLKVLVLVRNQVTDKGLIKLAETLVENNVIKEVNMDENEGITNVGCKAAVTLLKRHMSLSLFTLGPPSAHLTLPFLDEMKEAMELLGSLKTRTLILFCSLKQPATVIHSPIRVIPIELYQYLAEFLCPCDCT